MYAWATGFCTSIHHTSRFSYTYIHSLWNSLTHGFRAEGFEELNLTHDALNPKTETNEDGCQGVGFLPMMQVSPPAGMDHEHSERPPSRESIEELVWNVRKSADDPVSSLGTRAWYISNKISEWRASRVTGIYLHRPLLRQVIPSFIVQRPQSSEHSASTLTAIETARMQWRIIRPKYFLVPTW